MYFLGAAEPISRDATAATLYTLYRRCLEALHTKARAVCHSTASASASSASASASSFVLLCSNLPSSILLLGGSWGAWTLVAVAVLEVARVKEGIAQSLG